MAASKDVRVKNAGLVGDVVPSNWVESKDYTRDGRNLKVGDLVMIARSDGRYRMLCFTKPILNACYYLVWNVPQ
jgi:hypothetical protein